MTQPLPSSESSEKGLLGSILLAPERILGLCSVSKVTVEWFHHPFHQTIFQAVLDMQKGGRPVDLISLSQYLEDRALLDKCGGAAFITELFTFVPSAANAPYYVEIMREKVAARMVIAKCIETAAKVQSDHPTTQEIYDTTSKAFLEVHEICVVTEPEDDYDKKAMMAYFDYVEDVASGKAKPEYFRTGLPSIDGEIGGFMRGQLVMIRGKKGVGKSLGAQKIISTNAFSARESKVALFTYEMPYNEYMNRLVADLGSISLRNIYDGKFSKGEMDSFQRSMTTIMGSNLRIYDTDRVKSRTPSAFFSFTRKHAKNHGLDIVVLDHHNLLSFDGGKKSDKRTDEAMHEFSAEFKAMCMELKVVGVLLAQENMDGGTFGSTQVDTDVDHCFSLTPELKMIDGLKRIVGTSGIYCDKCRTGNLLGRKIPLRLVGKFARLEEPEKEVVRATESDF